MAAVESVRAVVAAQDVGAVAAADVLDPAQPVALAAAAAADEVDGDALTTRSVVDDVVRARPAVEQIGGARTGCRVVVAGQRVVACAAVQLVGAGAAGQPVDAAVADEQVRARAAVGGQPRAVGADDVVAVTGSDVRAAADEPLQLDHVVAVAGVGDEHAAVVGGGEADGAVGRQRLAVVAGRQRRSRVAQDDHVAAEEGRGEAVGLARRSRPARLRQRPARTLGRLLRRDLQLDGAGLGGRGDEGCGDGGECGVR